MDETTYKSRLRDAYDYADRRVKHLTSMRCWSMSTGHYHSSCTVMIRFPDGGGMEVVVAGDAPVDPVVEEFVGGEGGTCKEYPRSVYGSTGRTIWLPVPLDRVAVIVELATVLDGLPGRHNFKRNHYFYEAPKAARFLRAYHQTLGG